VAGSAASRHLITCVVVSSTIIHVTNHLKKIKLAYINQKLAVVNIN